MRGRIGGAEGGRGGRGRRGVSKKKKKKKNGRTRGGAAGPAGFRVVASCWIRVSSLPRWHCSAAAPTAGSRATTPRRAGPSRAPPPRSLGRTAARRSPRRRERARSRRRIGARLDRGARARRVAAIRGRGGGEGRSGRALELSRLDATTSRVGRLGEREGGSGRGGGARRGRARGGKSDGRGAYLRATSAIGASGASLPPSARSSARGACGVGASASVPNATTRFQRRDQWRRTNIARRSRSEPITERLKPPIAV